MYIYYDATWYGINIDIYLCTLIMCNTMCEQLINTASNLFCSMFLLPGVLAQLLPPATTLHTRNRWIRRNNTHTAATNWLHSQVIDHLFIKCLKEVTSSTCLLFLNPITERYLVKQQICTLRGWNQIQCLSVNQSWKSKCWIDHYLTSSADWKWMTA